MREPSTSKVNNITIPTKKDQHDFLETHWQIHKSEGKRMAQEQQKLLEDNPNPSCPTCYSKSTTVSEEFDNFFQTITQYQDITDYTGRTEELFKFYNQATDIQKQSQLAVAVAVSFNYGSTYWKGNSDLTAVIELIKAYQKGALQQEPAEELQEELELVEENPIADTSFIDNTNKLFQYSSITSDSEYEAEQNPPVIPSRKDKGPLHTLPRSEIQNFFEKFQQRPDTPTPIVRSRALHFKRPILTKRPVSTRRPIPTTMTTSTSSSMDLLAQAMAKLTDHVTNSGNNRPREYSLMKIDTFSGDEQDPMEWWQMFEKAT